jgi:hypothetical protein
MFVFVSLKEAFLRREGLVELFFANLYFMSLVDRILKYIRHVLS